MAIEQKKGCPRHGRDIPVDLGPRIRCDCIEMLMAALAPLRRGKWVSSGLPQDLHALHGDRIQDRAEQAITEAVRLAYELGLRGGIKPEMVQTCTECSAPFFTEIGRPGVCTPCYMRSVGA